MKFGKRYARYIAARNPEVFFSYARFKEALANEAQLEVSSAAAAAEWDCDRVLKAELQAFSAFLDAKTACLEAAVERLAQGGASEKAACTLAQEIKDVLNQGQLTYIAVVKAAKKRNRHLIEACGAEIVKPLLALELLGSEAFFCSPRLAQLSIHVEVLVQQAAQRRQKLEDPISNPKAEATQLLSNWECPICLETLHQPVVLTCAHRFCRTCAASHAKHCNQNAANYRMSTAQPTNSVDKGQITPNSTENVSEDDKVQQQTQAQAMPPWALGTFQMMEEDLHDVDDSRVAGEQEFFACPVCRKAQVLDLSSLQVDDALHSHIQELRRLSGVKAPTETPWGLLPPQSPQHKGKLTVLLDLDGTLITSFPPKRAPRVPPTMRTHLVGIGSKLNPLGVFVVERPELKQFLQAVSNFAEVVVFTAGFEDYAKPIIDAIDPKREFICHTLYRDSTLATEHYQCVKDMNRLNRPLERVVLVDDTPLAFLHQPDNGIPMLPYRGGSEDRLLLEAVLPLLQDLSKTKDVQPMLRRRFGMTPWFKRRGLPIELIRQHSALAAQLERERHSNGITFKAQQQPSPPSLYSKPEKPRQPPLSPLPESDEEQDDFGEATNAPASAALPSQQSTAGKALESRKAYTFVTDFDKTLVDFDAGERIIEELAPELLPMLVGIEGPTNFIPITNQLLEELQRRGVSRDQLLQCCKQLGAEVPTPTLALMHVLKQKGVEVRILSDCNSVFISHILTGAGLANDFFKEVLTNPATFQSVSKEDASGMSSPVLESNSSRSDRSDSESSSHSDSSSKKSSSSSKSSRSSLDSSSSTSKVTSSASSSSKSKSWFMKSFSKLVPASSSSKPTLPIPIPASPQSPNCRDSTDGGLADQKLVIRPYHADSHNCPNCPSNLCKGAEIRKLKAAGSGLIIYAGDGSNDICACAALGLGDVVLGRKGHPLGDWAEAYTQQPGSNKCTVHIWSTHAELELLVRELVACAH